MSDNHDPLKDVDPLGYVEERRRRYENAQQEFLRVFNSTAFPRKLKNHYLLESGEAVHNVHDRSRCEGHGCAIHHPSDHALKDAPRNWQQDMIWRTCKHGVDHPDYDSIVFILDRDGNIILAHDCCADNCCGLPEWIEIDDA